MLLIVDWKNIYSRNVWNWWKIKIVLIFVFMSQSIIFFNFKQQDTDILYYYEISNCVEREHNYTLN